MIPKPLPLHSVADLPPLTWAELAYGFSQGYIGWRTPVDFAVKEVEEGKTDAEVLDLASVGKNEVWKVGDLLRRLAVNEPERKSSIQEKWLFILLRWLYDNRESFQDPLQEVEEVYADFDYPDAVSGFVRFLPPNDGYRPESYTQEENQRRLYRNWAEYLEKAAQQFCA